jgi:nucleoside 2-deoxyribosyltransferase
MPSVYVAGAFVHKPTVQVVQSTLRKIGYTITLDWTLSENDNGGANPDLLREFSRRDMQGVRDADVVVAVFNDPVYAYRGTFAELGAALALRKPTFVYDMVSNDDSAVFRQVPFFWDAGVTRVRRQSELVDLLSCAASEDA